MTRTFETESDVDRRRSVGAFRLILIVATAALTFSAVAPARNEERAKAGLVTWKSSGCADCHGAFANGEKQRDESPSGADLRTTRLDGGALKLTISCGRPGAEMPAFGDDAYTARACTGQPGGDLYPAPRALTADEIDAVVAYLQGRIVGRGRITKAECLAYYDNQPGWCDGYN